MVQSGAPLNLSNISRTNTYIGPAILLEEKGVVIAFGSMYGNTRVKRRTKTERTKVSTLVTVGHERLNTYLPIN